MCSKAIGFTRLGTVRVKWSKKGSWERWQVKMHQGYITVNKMLDKGLGNHIFNHGNQYGIYSFLLSTIRYNFHFTSLKVNMSFLGNRLLSTSKKPNM